MGAGIDLSSRALSHAHVGVRQLGHVHLLHGGHGSFISNTIDWLKSILNVDIYESKDWMDLREAQRLQLSLSTLLLAF